MMTISIALLQKVCLAVGATASLASGIAAAWGVLIDRVTWWRALLSILLLAVVSYVGVRYMAHYTRKGRPLLALLFALAYVYMSSSSLIENFEFVFRR